jgi:large subunit ribosomal protein L9
MKVILLEDVKSHGKKGDIVDISDGYAKNYILPKKLGVEANSKNLNDLKLQNANAQKIAAQKLADAQALADQLADKQVSLKIKVGKDGRAFGSISTKEIAQAVKEQLDIELDKKKMVLPVPIRDLGTFTVNLKLHAKVTGELKVVVTEK